MSLLARTVAIARMVANTKRLRAAVIDSDPKESRRAESLKRDADRVDAMANGWQSEDKFRNSLK